MVFLFGLFGLFLFFPLGALAVNPFDLQFPIIELGNCDSLETCKLYCDGPANIDRCLSWARANGFAPEEPLRKEGIKGPGGCDSEKACDNYCHKPDNMNECLDFAVKEGFMTKVEAEKIRSLQSQEKEFRSRARVNKRPDIKIEKPDEPEVDRDKVLRLLEEKNGPGDCKTFAECDNYCSSPVNQEECFSFALENGLIDAKETEKFKKLVSLEGPGGCRQKECEAYCDQPNHQKECLEFAHKNGFISEEEYQETKKFVGILETGGPGSCKNEEECEAYCSEPANQEECFAFAKTHGLLPEEDQRAIEEVREIEQHLREEGARREQESERFKVEEFKQEFQKEEIKDRFQDDFEFKPEFQKQFQENFEKEFNLQFEEQFQRQLEEQTKNESYNIDSRDLGGIILYPFLKLLTS